MSGAFGKNSLSMKKQITSDSALLSLGVKKLKFAHQFAASGSTSIDFSSLNTPADMVTNGFIQPSSAEILAANLRFYRDNVKVFSSLNGELMDYLTYSIGNTSLTFLNGYVSTIDEIIVVTFDQNVKTGMPIVDAQPLVATGILTAGSTDFNAGQAFRIGQYASQQVGEVMVYVDGQIQFRNVGNATADPTADGNYQEVHASGGYGTIIRFNDVFPADVNIIVVSTNLLVEKPEVSTMQVIEELAGQIDAMIPTLALLAGVPESNFQGAPNNIDLKVFGDKVTSLNTLSGVDPNDTDLGSFTGSTISDNSSIKVALQALETKVETNNICYIKDIKAANTAGGTFTSGAWQTRTLNTLNTDGGLANSGCSWCTLAGNRFTLPVGTYEMEIAAPACAVERHKLILVNATIGGTVAWSSSGKSTSAHAINNWCFIQCTISLASSTSFEIQHRCESTFATQGFGCESNLGGEPEIYTRVKIKKLA